MPHMVGIGTWLRIYQLWAEATLPMGAGSIVIAALSSSFVLSENAFWAPRSSLSIFWATAMALNLWLDRGLAKGGFSGSLVSQSPLKHGGAYGGAGCPV